MTCGFATPDPNEDRGKPRVQYKRTYILLPQDAGRDWARAVVDATWDEERYTIGSSADDAGIGDLDYRRIIAVNPDSSSYSSSLREFFETYYPGVIYEPVYAKTPEDLAKILNPVPPVTQSIIGLHDQAGAEWMIKDENKVKGWCVIPLYLNTSAIEIAGLQRYKDAGVNVILRLNYSYAVDDGGQGTLPGPDQIHEFANACVSTVIENSAAWGFILANEPNNKREHPAGYDLTPQYYANFYNEVYDRIPPVDRRISPAGIDPYNPGWGDWRVSWSEVYDRISGADFLSFHCYTHGWSPELIRADTKFGDPPLVGVHYDMRVLEDQQAIVPARFSTLPQVVTETNPDADGTLGWPDDGAWIHEACSYFRERGVVGSVLFRYNYDKWRINDKPQALQAVKEESND